MPKHDQPAGLEGRTKAYRSLFEQNPLAVIYWNTQFEVLEWNEAATRVFGYSADEVVGTRAASLIVPAPVRGFVEQLWEGLLSGKSQRVTNANVTKDGRTILCEWNSTPLVDEADQVMGVVSICTDVTERARESDALKRSEARFRSLIELLPDAISVVREGQFLYVNPALARYLGYASPEELCALPTTVMVPPDEIERSGENPALLRPSLAAPVEYTLRRKDGDLVTCE